MSRIERVVVIILCVLIPVLVVFGALIKLEHWSEIIHNLLFAAGLFLSAVLVLYVLLKSYYNKK